MQKFKCANCNKIFDSILDCVEHLKRCEVCKDCKYSLLVRNNYYCFCADKCVDGDKYDKKVKL